MMKTLQDKLNKLSRAEFIKLYKNWKSYCSEQRTIIQNNYVDGSSAYAIKFTYILATDDTLFRKGETAIYNIVDKILFNTYNDAEEYIKEAQYPITNYVKNHKNRYYLNLKSNDIIYETLGYYPEFIEKSDGEYIYGLYNTVNYDKQTFTDFLYLIRKRIGYIKSTTVIKSFDIKDLTIIELSDDIDKLIIERNDIVVKEIKRTEQYLKFLKTLLK